MAYQTIYIEWFKINLRETRREKVPWMPVCYLYRCHDLDCLAPKEKGCSCWPENGGDLFIRRLGLWLRFFGSTCSKGRLSRVSPRCANCQPNGRVAVGHRVIAAFFLVKRCQPKWNHTGNTSQFRPHPGPRGRMVDMKTI
jgi:hypothetical protein